MRSFLSLHNRSVCWVTISLLGASVWPAVTVGQSPPAPARPTLPVTAPAVDPFQGFDFGQVLERIEESVDPLQEEMRASFLVFVRSIEAATMSLERGEIVTAIEEAVTAVEGVLIARDKVLEPMWRGQDYLVEQTALVRERLADGISPGGGLQGRARLAEATEKMLDRVAAQIAAESDVWRRQRLVSHYTNLRNIARIRQLAKELSSDQQMLWMNVLRVLEEAAATHLQVMLGSEALFVQFASTRDNLKSYLALLDTLDGASAVLGRVRGDDGDGSGIAAFATNLAALQEQLAGFNGAIERVIRSSMTDLTDRVDEIQSQDPLAAQAPTDPATLDEELVQRMARLRGASVRATP